MYKYCQQNAKKVTGLCGLIGIAQLLMVLTTVFNAGLLNALIKHNLKSFEFYLFTLIGVWIIAIAFQFLATNYQERVIQDIDLSIRQHVANNIQSQPIDKFSSRPVGTYVSWLNNDIQIINDQGLAPLFMIVTGVLGTFFSLIALWRYHIVLAIAAGILAIPILLSPRLFSKQLEQANQRTTTENEKFVGATTDILNAFKFLYAFQSTKLIQNRVTNSSKTLKSAYIQRTSAQTNVLTVGFFGNVIAQLLLIGLSGYLAYQGSITIGAIEAVGLLASTIFNSLGNMSNYLGLLQSTNPIFEKYETVSTISPRGELVPGAQNSELTVRNLAYSYGQQAVFKNANFNFEHAKKYQIVGESGSGKSTFLKILAGYLPAYTGNILINGQDYQTFSPEKLRQQIVYLDQTSHAFVGTVRENLSILNHYDDTELTKWLLQMKLIQNTTDADAFLNKRIGTDAANLSGGQLQRIALIRALLRKPKILLLDEGTSAIDTKNAIEIENILLTIPNQTLIMVSHTSHAENVTQFDQTYHFQSDGHSEARDQPMSSDAPLVTLD